MPYNLFLRSFLGYSKLMSKDDAEREVDRIMAAVDTNNSGEIDYSEFVTASINRQKLLSKEKLDIVFKMFDKVFKKFSFLFFFFWINFQ